MLRHSHKRRAGGSAHARGRGRVTPARLSLVVAALYALWLAAVGWSRAGQRAEGGLQPSTCVARWCHAVRRHQPRASLWLDGTTVCMLRVFMTIELM
jgi:hypothetical protein